MHRVYDKNCESLAELIWFCDGIPNLPNKQADPNKRVARDNFTFIVCMKNCKQVGFFFLK